MVLAAILCIVGGIAAGSPARASAGTFEVDACTPYTATSGVFQHAAVFGIGTGLGCHSFPETDIGMDIFAHSGNNVPVGRAGRWYTETPSGLTIADVVVPAGDLYALGMNDGGGWGGGFWWPGGGAEVKENPQQLNGFHASPNTSFFEWQIVCGSPTCNKNIAELQVRSIRLTIQENGSPSITPTSSLSSQTGWIRGNAWPLSFQTDDPSGTCHVQATVGPTVFQGATTLAPNHTAWHQCSVTSFNKSVNTTDYPNGPLNIELQAYNAAGNWATRSSAVHVDNSPVQVSLSGPTDEPSTAGTQHITAAAAAGPSGVSGIGCTLDGAPYRWYPAATVQVPVAGVGIHHLTCYGANNSRDVAGRVATSAKRSWTLRIGEPTESVISFTKIADKLRCRRVKTRVKVPSQTVSVRRRGKLVKVRKPAHMKTVRVTRCHPRTVRKKVTVWRTVTRHGKKVRVKQTKWKRVVVLPHTVAKTTRRVPYGKGTTVSGWLGTMSGTALAGQPVTIYTAPDNGLKQFTPAATAVTGSNGAWSVPLRPGPSRLVEAGYGGSATMEPSTSTRVRLIVPAKVKLLSVTPRRIPWGGTVRIVGQLEGGYLPSGGENVRLRYGVGSHFATWGVQEHVTGSGRFATPFHFGAGLASVHRRFWFELAALPTSSYPFAQAHSGRRYVLVGGHPRRRH